MLLGSSLDTADQNCDREQICCMHCLVISQAVADKVASTGYVQDGLQL
jgi:hypothetical protein